MKLEVNKLYRITWHGEDRSVEARFEKEDRGFLLFWQGWRSRVVCRPDVVTIVPVNTRGS